jgi:hypothetical protein
MYEEGELSNHALFTQYVLINHEYCIPPTSRNSYTSMAHFSQNSRILDTDAGNAVT